VGERQRISAPKRAIGGGGAAPPAMRGDGQPGPRSVRPAATPQGQRRPGAKVQGRRQSAEQIARPHAVRPQVVGDEGGEAVRRKKYI
jgi:hypothetical protein